MDGGLPQTPSQPVSQKELQKETTATQTSMATGTVTKDFGSGFTLTQNIDQTELNYSGTTIKTWAHTPSQKFPFGRESPCALMSQGLESYNRDNMISEERSLIWDTLSEKDKKTCTAEHTLDNVRVSPTPNPRFMVLRGYAYYRVFDTQTLKTYGDAESERPIQDIIQNILIADKHILIATRSSFDDSDQLLIFSENFEFQKKWAPSWDPHTTIEKIESISQTGATLVLKELKYTAPSESHVSSRTEIINF